MKRNLYKKILLLVVICSCISEQHDTFISKINLSCSKYISKVKLVRVPIKCTIRNKWRSDPIVNATPQVLMTLASLTESWESFRTYRKVLKSGQTSVPTSLKKYIQNTIVGARMEPTTQAEG